MAHDLRGQQYRRPEAVGGRVFGPGAFKRRPSTWREPGDEISSSGQRNAFGSGQEYNLGAPSTVECDFGSFCAHPQSFLWGKR